MKKAYKSPHIGTRAELKKESIRTLKALVAYLNWYKGRAVICKNMIAKLLGISKCWNYLNKQGLIDILTAWKNLNSRWKKSRGYQQVNQGSEVQILTEGKVYKQYIPAQKLWQARAIASEAPGLWIAIRRAKRCSGWKWEVECWHPNSQADLLNETTTTYTSSGSFTQKKCDRNPFFTPEKTKPIKEFRKAVSIAYEDIFGEPEAGYKARNKILQEIEEACKRTGWRVSWTNDKDYYNFSVNVFEVIFKETVIRQHGYGEPFEKEVIQMRAEHYPKKGWFDVTESRLIGNWTKGKESLEQLTDASKNYVPF